MTTRTETPQHTPTPWVVDYNFTVGHIKSVAPHAKGWTPTVCRYDFPHRAHSIPDDEARANAEFIVRAVNSFEENQRTIAALVEALEKALLFMRNVPTDDQLDARLRNGVTGRDAVDAAELALAAAKVTK